MGIGWFWKKKGVAKEELKDPEAEEDLEEVITFLKGLEVKELIRKLETLEHMFEESKVIEEKLKEENILMKIKLFEEILQKYGFLENDVDINGLRLKKIGAELLRRAKERGMDSLVKEKLKDMKWR